MTLIIIEKIQKNISNYFYLYLFLSILLTLSPFGSLSGNEEMYYGLAKKFLEPNWNGEYSSFILSGDYRFISDYIIGTMLSLFGFEKTQIIGSVFASLLFAHAIFILCKTLKITNIYGLLSIIVFILLGQSFIGREWIFEDFEAKIFAYYFVILAIDQYIKKGSYKMIVFLSIATYFHILVGASWFGLLILALFLSDRGLKQLLKTFSLYSILCFPIIFLAITGFNSSDYVYDQSLPSPSYIYSYIRQYKMVVPFYSIPYFIINWLPGITIYLGILVSVFLSRKFLQTTSANRLNTLILSSGLVIFIFLIISFFDSDGVFAKNYPYRFTSLLLLLVLLYTASYLKSEDINKKLSTGFLILVSIVPFFLINGAINSLTEIKSEYLDSQHKENLYSYLSKNTLSNEIILIDPLIEKDLFDLERKINRPTLFTFKYIPSSKEGLIEWYKRKQYKSKIFSNNFIQDEHYDYGYLVLSNDSSSEILKSNHLNIYSNEKYIVLGKNK